jgi:hypothetical protein
MRKQKKLLEDATVERADWSDRELNIHPDFAADYRSFLKTWSNQTPTEDMKSLCFYYFRMGSTSAALTHEKSLPLSVEQKAALDLAVLNLKTHGDDQLLAAVKPIIEYLQRVSQAPSI